MCKQGIALLDVARDGDARTQLRGHLENPFGMLLRGGFLRPLQRGIVINDRVAAKSEGVTEQPLGLRVARLGFLLQRQKLGGQGGFGGSNDGGWSGDNDSGLGQRRQARKQTRQTPEACEFHGWRLYRYARSLSARNCARKLVRRPLGACESSDRLGDSSAACVRVAGASVRPHTGLARESRLFPRRTAFSNSKRLIGGRRRDLRRRG